TVATYWAAFRVSATPIVTTAPLVSVPVRAKRVTVDKGWAKIRKPGPAVTLVSGCGPDTLNRIAPSAPALGVASETVSTPATGPVPPSPLQLPAPPARASPTSSHPPRRVIDLLPSAWPRSRAPAARLRAALQSPAPRRENRPNRRRCCCSPTGRDRRAARE